MQTSWQGLNIYLTSRQKTQIQCAEHGILLEVGQKYQGAKMYFLLSLPFPTYLPIMYN